MRSLLATVANRLGFEDAPLGHVKGSKHRTTDYCKRCNIGDHSGYHDPALGCMDIVAPAPADFMCLCGLSADGAELS